MQKSTIQFTVLSLLFVLALLTARSQNCPKLKSALIDGCGRDGDNEFVVFQTRGQTVSLASIKVEYSTSLSFTPGAATVVINPGSSISAWKNPSVPATNGLTNSLGTIVAINPLTTTTIGPNSTVVIIPDAGAVTNPYDLQVAGQVQVLFYDTTHPSGTSTSWTGTGNFSNYGNSGLALNPRFFRLTTNSGGSCPATQTVSYTPSNLVKQNGSVGAQDGAKTYWDDAADATVTLSDANGTVHYLNTGCTAITLPVNLVSFHGSESGGHAYLQWETAGGSDAVLFVVERSGDGNSYNAIGQVQAQNGDDNQQYSFTDMSPLAGNNFYRLEMEDVGHQLSYSNVLVLGNGAYNGISIYPNPVKDMVSISTEANSTATVMLFNSNGQILQTRSFAGNNMLTLDLSGYPTGLYLLRIVNGGSSSSYKLFKQ